MSFGAATRAQGEGGMSVGAVRWVGGAGRGRNAADVLMWGYAMAQPCSDRRAQQCPDDAGRTANALR